MHQPPGDSTAEDVRPTDNGLVVASFNIRNGVAFDGLNSWPFRRRTTARATADLDADVVGMQEVFGFQRRYLLRKLTGYTAVGRGRSRRGTGEQCPILVRHPVEISSFVNRWFGDHPDQPGTQLPDATFPRIATIARCRHNGSGQRFEVANLHLDEHLTANRARSLEMLADWLDPTVPSLVMGDFNTRQNDSTVFAPLRDAGFHFVSFEGGTSHQFRGDTNGPRIDHVLTRSTASVRWEVVSSEVRSERRGRFLPSDHWPVRAHLRLIATDLE